MAQTKITKKKLQFRFESRPQNRIIKTKVHLQFGQVEKKNGIIHKIYGVSDRFVGDVPSLTKTLQNAAPKSTVGKIGVTAAKVSYGALKTANTVIKKPLLTAETATLRANKLVRNVLSPSRQLQFRFERHPENRFLKNTVHLQFGDKTEKTPHGLIHRIDNFKTRFVGDVPSLTKTLQNAAPKSTVGKIGIKTVKYGYNVSKAGKFLIKKPLLMTENVAKGLSVVATRHIAYNAVNKIRQNGVDDISRGLISYGSIVKDLYLGLKNRQYSKANYKAQKNKLKTKENALRFSKDNQKSGKKELKSQLTVNKQKFKAEKEKFKHHKKLNKINGEKNSNVRKQLYNRRKAIYKEKKKDINFEKKELRKNTKLSRKDLSKQKKAVKDSKPLSVVSQPLNYSFKKLASFAGSALTADENNDITQALRSAGRTANTLSAHIKVKEKKKAQKKQKSVQNRLAKNQSKLQVAQNRLENQKHYIEKTRKRKNHRQKPKYKYKANTLKGIKERTKVVAKKAGKCLIEVVKKSMISLLPVMIIVLIITTLLTSFLNIFSKSGFVLGTYITDDYNIAQAEEYYTNLAYEANQKLIRINSDDWEDALQDFGVDTSDYDDDPQQFIFGRSSRFSADPKYDYDPYKLISYLCAYGYDYNDTNDNQDYWEFDGDMEEACEQLFNKEYTFKHFYSNHSHFENLNPYKYFGGGSYRSVVTDTSTCSYYRMNQDEVYRSDNPQYRYKFKVESRPNEIADYIDENGYLYFKDSDSSHDDYEIVNPNDDFKETGFCVRDTTKNCCAEGFNIIREDESTYPAEAFYRRTNNTAEIPLYSNITPYKQRTGLGWNNADGTWDEAWFIITHTDADVCGFEIPDNCGLYAVVQKRVWVTQCQLYYTMWQNCTIDQAAESILINLDNGEERVKYYRLLANGEQSEDETVKFYGNHQSILSPIKDNGMNKIEMNGNIFNKYGYDMQEWGSEHCALEDSLHKGIDIVADPHSYIIAPVDGKITEIDKNRYIVIETEPLDIWESTNRKVRVTLKNVYSTDYNWQVGDTIHTGQIIGRLMNMGNECDDDHCNDNLSISYLHMNIELDYGGFTGYASIDPTIFINR